MKLHSGGGSCLAASCRIPSSVSRRFKPRIVALLEIQKADGTRIIWRSVAASETLAAAAVTSKLFDSVGLTYQPPRDTNGLYRNAFGSSGGGGGLGAQYEQAPHSACWLHVHSLHHDKQPEVAAAAESALPPQAVHPPHSVGWLQVHLLHQPRHCDMLPGGDENMVVRIVLPQGVLRIISTVCGRATDPPLPRR